MSNTAKQLERVVIRFAGDSGDGVQTIGDQFGLSSAVAGNDIATLPDFPAEIRAPAGTVYGVSGFQLQFGADSTLTAGDAPDVLVAFNAAALKRHLADLPHGGTVILDPDHFTKRTLALAGYEVSPLEDDSLKNWHLHAVPMEKMVVEALKPLGVTGKAAKRCLNFFALGLSYWIYSRPLEPTLKFLDEKFANKPEVRDANVAALKAGYHYGETAEAFQARYEVPAAEHVEPGTYRSINGNQALAYGLVTAGHKAGLPLFFAGYPITPASDLLHNLASLRALGATTFQAEDEIAAIGAALGGSYAGALGVTASSGPGIALKGEFMGLAVSIELPLVVINVQRGGPSTGLPTKMEQSDLLQAIFGRHGEAPMPVVAARSPSDAFNAAIEAARIAITYRTPVMLLCDGNIAFGTEPWHIPNADSIPAIDPKLATSADAEGFLPFGRDPETGARPWAVPGTAGLEHRITGIEKEDGSGNISYDPDNHQLMTDLRAAKVAKVADSYAPTEVIGDQDGDLLVLSWGSPYGPVTTAVRRYRAVRRGIGHVHLRNLWPLPNDLGDILKRFDKVLIPENNCGQLRALIRSEYLIDAHGVNQVRGLPFKVADLEAAIHEQLAE
ncbi:MAG: 2-oxoacid:acceptor oxidoreductase subunit alpha [Planctomycetota bacterium]|jgi:2-oxoglutarate ferredoxin oxidoreductase subunit alpha